MKAKAPSLSDAVLARARNRKPGFIPWHQRLPDEVRRDLEAIRRSWQSGQTGLTKRAMADAIIAEMRERGFQIPGNQGVERWLNENA